MEKLSQRYIKFHRALAFITRTSLYLSAVALSYLRKGLTPAVHTLHYLRAASTSQNFKLSIISVNREYPDAFSLGKNSKILTWIIFVRYILLSCRFLYFSSIPSHPPLHYRFKPGLAIHLHFLFLSILIQFSLHPYPLYIARTHRIQLYIYHFFFSVTHYSYKKIKKKRGRNISKEKKMYKYISLYITHPIGI